MVCAAQGAGATPQPGLVTAHTHGSIWVAPARACERLSKQSCEMFSFDSSAVIAPGDMLFPWLASCKSAVPTQELNSGQPCLGSFSRNAAFPFT